MLGRRMAVAILLLPLLLAIPVRIWIMRFAGSWLVSTDIDPDQRAMFLGLWYIPFMGAITVTTTFVSLLLLFRSRYRPMLTGVALVIVSILLLPTLLFIATIVHCYFLFR